MSNANDQSSSPATTTASAGTHSSATPQLADLKLKSKKRMGKWSWLALLVVVLLVVAYGWSSLHQQTLAPWLTEKVERGNIEASITATGTLQPLQLVDIGSELSGTITELFVDENDVVKKGQILAKLDTSKLQDAVERARATLLSSQAAVEQAKANLNDAKWQLQRLQEAHKLSDGQVPARMDLDNAVSNQKRMQAALSVALSNVTQAQSTLQSERTNLAKAVIRSPIDGVVLARKVALGQTVAASLSTPTLFTIAEDLSRMQLGVSIDEADVSQVRPDMRVRFTVPAYQQASFPATIERITLGSTLTDNVVTYKAVLHVNNADHRLRPGMTATARIITVSVADTLIVSNAALRFNYDMALQSILNARGGSAQQDASLFGMGKSFRPRREKQVTETLPQAGAAGTRMGTLWILKNQQPTRIRVTIGASDGKNSAVSAPELQEGTEVLNGLPAHVSP